MKVREMGQVELLIFLVGARKAYDERPADPQRQEQLAHWITLLQLERTRRARSGAPRA